MGQGHAAVVGLLEAQGARWRLGVRLYEAAYRGDLGSAEDALSLGAPVRWCSLVATP